ncbi:hypothetical protein CHUAL_014231 [Chamberlinius hualienensis]
MNTDMTVVTIKYRLGILGFLATDDEVASGNFGLLDQNLALKWVQANIGSFGGNPHDVTLTGQSAGGASVIYHYLSPMSAGLFQKAVVESGSPLNPWALEENPSYYPTVVGEHFNCSNKTTKILIDCLREVPAEELVQFSFITMLENTTFCFAPTIETSSSGQFLTEDPLTLLEIGNFNHVPLQIGFNRDEGLLVYPYVYFLFININNYTWNEAIPNILRIITDYETNLVNVSYAIKDRYYSKVDYLNQTQVNIATINWISDVYIKSGVAKVAQLMSSHNIPTHFYAYNYVSSKSLSNFTGEPDVRHAQELDYLWYTNITDENDLQFGNKFFQLWVNFIFTGNPILSAEEDDQWLITPPGQYNYYDINQIFTMRGNYNSDNMNFWWNTVPEIVNS